MTPSMKTKLEDRIVSVGALCVIAVTVAFAFSPALQGGFIHWDDTLYVTDNPFIREITPHTVGTLLTTPFGGTYQPVVNLSFLLEYRLFGLDPAGYHATNLLLHICNCLLVFWIICLLDGSVAAAFVTALLFGVHPLRVESVAWVSERKDVLCGLFYLLALAQYCLYVKRGSVKRYYLSFFLFILSLGSKAIAVTLPIVFFLADYLVGRRFTKQTVGEKAPFLAASLLFGAIALFAQGASLGVGPGRDFDPLLQITAALYGITMYACKTFFPSNLSLIYPYPVGDSAYYATAALAVILVTGVVVAALISSRYTRKVVFALSFSFFTILPVLQLVPFGSAIMADRYTYLPSIGVAYLISVGLLAAYGRICRDRPVLRRVAVAALSGVIVVLSVMTYQRAGVWKDSIAIFSDVIAKHPNAYEAYNNRGVAYAQKGDLQSAAADFERSIQMRADQFAVCNNLAGIYYTLRAPEKAVEMLVRAIALKPDAASGYFNLASAYVMMGRKAEADALYRKALELDPHLSGPRRP